MKMYRLIVITCLFVGGYCGVCKLYNVGDYKECKGAGVTGLNSLKALSRHNYWRTMIAQNQVPGQPQSSNMLRMQWDKMLASSAQQDVNSCMYAKAANQTSAVAKRINGVNIGKNVYVSLSNVWIPDSNWTEAIDSWFNEVKDFTYPNTTATGKTTGNYTQLVWAKSYAVGCGYAGWYDGTTTYTKLYICKYGPAGNIAGQAPYETGEGCKDLCTP